jgi:aspartate aminotransferase
MSGWVRPAASKSLALGDGRAGAARSAGRIASEIWSATAAPVQHAAAVAFTEPPELAERIARSRSLHAAVCRAVAARFTAAGLDVRPSQAAFYLYPGFRAWRGALAARHRVTTGQRLARRLLDRDGMGVLLPASVSGEDATALRLRVATGLLYGDTDAQRELALASPNPVTLAWVAAAAGLDQRGEVTAG